MALIIKKGNNYGIKIECKCGEHIVCRWHYDEQRHVDGLEIEADRSVLVNRIEARKSRLNLPDGLFDKLINGNKE